MPNIIFFGMQGILSLPPLQALVEAGVKVNAVVIPADRAATLPLPRRVEPPRPAPSDLPMITSYVSPSIVHLAWAQQIPVWQVGSLADPQTLALLIDLQPDVIVVACFPRIFPPTLLQLSRYGCLNLHPSLLPAYRGPLPLFWMARQGERQIGVTLHFLDEGLDTGDIVAQTTFDWPDGISLADLEQRCANEGAQLLLVAMQQLIQGGQLPCHPQPARGSSYFSWPSVEDFYIPTDWEARRAFNFLRLAADWPLVIEVGGEAGRRGDDEAGRRRREETNRRFFAVRAAISYDVKQILDQPYVIENDELWVQFNPGVLKAKV